MAIFSPQSKQPSVEYLHQLRSFLRRKDELKPFLQAIENLPATWSILASHRKDIAVLEQGPKYINMLSNWIAEGEVSEISTLMSSILVLPLLTIIQVGQYFHFLELKRWTHHEFLTQLRNGGGIQGYCGGLLPAVAIACSDDESEVVTLASKSMHLALCIGAYAELGDDLTQTGPSLMVVRFKYSGQAEEIIKDFPGVRDANPLGMVKCFAVAN